MHSLPLFLKLEGRPVILLGEGEAAEAKRRLLERAGADILEDEQAQAALAIVAIEDEVEALAAIARLKAALGAIPNVLTDPAPDVEILQQDGEAEFQHFRVGEA